MTEFERKQKQFHTQAVNELIKVVPLKEMEGIFGRRLVTNPTEVVNEIRREINYPYQPIEYTHLKTKRYERQIP